MKLDDASIDLISGLDRASEAEWGVYVTTAETALGRRSSALERAIFFEEYGNDASLMEREYGPYENRSFFASVVHEPSLEVVATMRLICGNVDQLKTTRDVALPPWNLSLDEINAHHGVDLEHQVVIDIATVGVAPSWRRGFLAPATQVLLGSVFPVSRMLGGQVWITVLDERAARVIRLVTGIIFDPFCESGYVEYLDSARSFAGLAHLGAYEDNCRHRGQLTDAAAFGTGPATDQVSRPVIDLRTAEERSGFVIA